MRSVCWRRSTGSWLGSPTQQFTERFERIFDPVVLALVAQLLFAWVVIDEPFSASLCREMAVLVAASPCALAPKDKLVAAGRTTTVLRKGPRFLGVIGVMDTPRPVASEVMA